MGTDSDIAPAAPRKRGCGCLSLIIVLIAGVVIGAVGIAVVAIMGPAMMLRTMTQDQPLEVPQNTYRGSLQGLERKVRGQLATRHRVELRYDELDAFLNAHIRDGSGLDLFRVRLDDEGVPELSVSAKLREQEGVGSYLNVQFAGDFRVEDGRFVQLVPKTLRIGELDVSEQLAGKELAYLANRQLDIVMAHRPDLVEPFADVRLATYEDGRFILELDPALFERARQAGAPTEP